MYNLKREEINNITPISIESSNKKIFLKKINGKDGFTQNITLLQKNENNELINEYVFPLNVELNDNSYIDIEGIHINGSVIELSQEQLDFFNNIVCIEGINVFEIDGNIQTEIEFNYVPLITEEIKQAVINNAEKAYIEVLDTGEIFDETNYLQEVKLNDERYVEGRGFIGSVIAKELTGKLINNNDDFYNLENKEIKYYDGPIMDNGSEKYFDYGTFIVQKPENDNVKDDTSFTAFDYMIKFNKKFEDRLDYSTGTVTVLELLEDICDQADVVLGTKNFRNSNFILENNQFVGGETCRDVLSNIAQIAFSWARINEDDELVLDFNPSNEIVETLNTDDYFDLKFNDLYGPINTIVLSNSVVTGENYTIHSPDFDPEIDEEIILEIQDNVFAYTEQKRYQLIQAGAALFGFQYVPITIKTCGRNYLNCLDKIRIKNVQNQNYDTYIFNNTLSYSGITLDEKKSPAMTNAEVKYEYTGDLSKGLKRTEIIVDKQEQKIEGIVSEIGDRTEKTTTITADIDGLNSQVQEIADVTETAESISASVSLEKINSSEPVEIKIHPIINNISYLYPRDNLYPSDDLYMTDRIIRFIRTYEEDEETKTENIDYLLPDDLLYYDSQIYDEFYLDYENKICRITKRCKYNADGTVGLLSQTVITDYEYPHILLNEGNYEVKLLGYNSGYLSVKLMLINKYTSQFTTRVEVNSNIEQTAEQINLEVSKKVGNDEIISKINQSAEEIQISADKIDIDGKAVHFKTQIDETLGPYTLEDINKSIEIIMGQRSPTTEELERYDVDGDGRISAVDWAIMLRAINSNDGYINTTGTFEINPYSSRKSIAIWNDKKNEYSVSLSPLSNYLNKITTQEIRIDVDNSKQLFTYYSGEYFELENENGNISGFLNYGNGDFDGVRFDLQTNYSPGEDYSNIWMECLNNGSATITVYGSNSGTRTEITNEGITTPTVTQTSLEESKKNFEKLENGLEIINNTDIYKYNMKSQKDGDKKHIGFVIGKEYKYSQEITSENNKGVDTYSMISVAYKAIQELSEQNKQLQKQIDELKGDK